MTTSEGVERSEAIRRLVTVQKGLKPLGHWFEMTGLGEPLTVWIHPVGTDPHASEMQRTFTRDPWWDVDGLLHEVADWFEAVIAALTPASTDTSPRP